MQIAILLFDQVTALDAIGPYEVLNELPGAEVIFTGIRTGPARTENGRLGLMVDATLAEIPQPDLIVVPGGYGVDAHLASGPVIDWLRRADTASTWMTSVCTGSPILAASGRSGDGMRPRTGWLSLNWPATAPSPSASGWCSTASTSPLPGVGRQRHGADPDRADRRGRRRAGDPAGHRVRPPAAV